MPTGRPLDPGTGTMTPEDIQLKAIGTLLALGTILTAILGTGIVLNLP